MNTPVNCRTLTFIISLALAFCATAVNAHDNVVVVPMRGYCAPVVEPPVPGAFSCSTDIAGNTVQESASLLGGSCELGECYACGTPNANLEQTGPEDVYEFTCQVDGMVTVDFNNLSCDLDFYVFETGKGVSQCIAGSTGVSTTSDSLSFNCTANTTYFVVLENPTGESACTYDIDFVVGSGGCPEDCDDGLDNDGNGDVDGDDAACM